MADYLRKTVSVLCPDGKTRMVSVRLYWDGQRACLAADTYFPVPAGVKLQGKYVSGFLAGRDGEPNLEFIPFTKA